MVFRALCDLPAIARTLRFAAKREISPENLDRLAFLAGMHDVGKANLGFQFKVLDQYAPQAGHVRELAPLLDPECSDDALREKFLATLPPDMISWFEDDASAYSYFMAAFSHHGQPLRFQGETSGNFFRARDEWWQPYNGLDPFQAVEQVIRWLVKAFPRVKSSSAPLPVAAPFHHRIAGLIMLADWLGSHPDWFPVNSVTFPERWNHNGEVIPELLRRVGLDVSYLRPVLISGPKDFRQRFGYSPRAVQILIEQLTPDREETRLCVIESETGSGKTEAVLNWFCTLFAAGKVDSLYFALPTRVAAQELHQRVAATIERWFPDPTLRPLTILAVPRYPDPPNVPEASALPIPDGHTLWTEPDTPYEEDMRLWAAERPKRFLAATVAVGTIDQALLSIVQTRHAHLRSICLDRALLVVDEVHASDIYMSRLLEDLLDHHLNTGGCVVLLSATLGARARTRFVLGRNRSANVPSLSQAIALPYPLITLRDGTGLTLISASAPKVVTFQVVPSFFSPEVLADEVGRALDAGARVLVVMNTVGRAISFFRALETHPEIGPDRLFRCQGVPAPHHGRFAPADRVILDHAVTEIFGAKSLIRSMLLIGTQTLEQSLDIDADLLVTDLCPADVLLQRVGRLHRHDKNRPPGFERPRCIVLTPREDLVEALDERGFVKPHYRREGMGSVYEDLRMLELTRRLLLEGSFTIPRDNRRLVEGTTHPEALASLDAMRWDRHGQLIEGQALAQKLAAGSAAATFDEYFGQFTFSESGGKIATRLGADSVRLPLSAPFRSPFGQILREIIIPGHMRPKELVDRVMVEEDDTEGRLLRCAGRQFRYSRVGLEAVQ
ncbi:MAG: CRISPR-associated helicase/endonuclease Cas3 [Sulfobacillus acidophilus]|uniref:CRISPR-associated helicase/endonuclease Cas3 n=1 Tax=Sulfobacillus acidophilus TaxID=53633 RepID=A0A2T2WE27_9FIRM|nr:MAG: CRISPR-associated helicase/endonuclease Cas3 [Sulfobacillus acidophilus]